MSDVRLTFEYSFPHEGLERKALRTRAEAGDGGFEQFTMLRATAAVTKVARTAMEMYINFISKIRIRF